MSLYDELAKQSRRRMLTQIGVTDRLIRQLYIRAAKSIGKQIESAKAGSLTERWLVAYKAELEKEIERLGNGIYAAIEDGARKAAEAAAECDREYLRRVCAQARIDDRFVSTLANVPTDALRAMLDGKLYTDGRMLSQRIWSATGRLEGNLAEIIQQSVAQQMDALTLARHLEAYVHPKAACPVSWHTLYPDIPFDRKVDYNALRLARTSITHAHWAAEKAAAKKNPLCRGLKWNLSNSHYERQIAVAGEDVCDEYARHDEGLGKGVWPIDDLPMPHPQCLCYQTEVVPDLDEAARILSGTEDLTDEERRRSAWARGEVQDDALDKDYERWKAEKLAAMLDKSDADDTIEAGDGFARRKKNTGAYKSLKVPVELRSLKRILSDMGLDYSGVKVGIDRNDGYIGRNLFGYTYPNGKTVTFYPDAFATLEELCRTIAHEHRHLQQLQRGQIATDSAASLQMEIDAESFADAWWENNGERMMKRYETSGWQ